MIFIVMALPAMILMVQAQRDYEEKMEILYAVLEIGRASCRERV